MRFGNLSFEWTAIFAVLAFMVAYLVGQAMHAVMGRQGFGAAGNMVILGVGFYLGMTVFDETRIVHDGLELRFAFGVGGAFLSLFALALMKRVLLRV